MKKRVTIHVLIDDNIADSSGVYKLPAPGYILPPGQPDEEYAVLLHSPYREDTSLPDTIENRLDIATHEFGHVLSGIFNSKGGVNTDPRPKGQIGLKEQLFGPNQSQALRVWASELQAWHLAEKMRPELNQILKSTALETYRPYLEQAERIQRRQRRLLNRGKRR